MGRRKRREFIRDDVFWNSLDETRSVFYFEPNELYEKKKFAYRRIRELIETDFFTGKQKDIVYLVMCERKSQRDVCDILGTSRYRVEQQISTIVHKLKKYFRKLDFFSQNKTLLGDKR